jgi:hypothetical protein
MLPNTDPPDTSARSRRHRRNLIASAITAALAITGTVVAITVSGNSRTGTTHGDKMGDDGNRGRATHGGDMGDDDNDGADGTLLSGPSGLPGTILGGPSGIPGTLLNGIIGLFGTGVVGVATGGAGGAGGAGGVAP